MAGAALFLAALPLFGFAAFYESFLYLVFFWVALATSWTILSGFSGYFSFGHGAFFGAGMYATANLTSKLDMPFLWTLPVAGLVAMLLGLAVGAVVFRVKRLRGELFALLTLAVTFILATIVLNTSLDGGPGVFLSGVKLPDIYANPSSTIYLFGLLIALVSMAVAWAVQYGAARPRPLRHRRRRGRGRGAGRADLRLQARGLRALLFPGWRRGRHPRGLRRLCHGRRDLLDHRAALCRADERAWAARATGSARRSAPRP